MPRQKTSGGKVILGSITKAGNCYLRRLLVQGAHTLLRYMERNKEGHKPIAWMHGTPRSLTISIINAIILLME